MKTVAIVQARMGSTRLPNKVMKEINGTPMIEVLLKRLAKSEQIDQIIVATSVDAKNDLLVRHVESLGYVCERGSENDVLERYYQAAKAHNADIVIRITGDCPLVDANLVDIAINDFKDHGVDYLSNTSPATYPDGLDIEVFTMRVLERALTETTSLFDQEHVTPYIRNSGKLRLIRLAILRICRTCDGPLMSLSILR
ncbi:cytidylyltransferase domain-containing protein [Psychrobacter cibarius]|uniref:cytidylyltransferase domain-containing protein n=1 Tax=Psychrobacter cibarius TaxID=282669 RepID=UPI00191B0F72|nr:glycosyltransferase family protein [Psychrobacter cibarius]